VGKSLTYRQLCEAMITVSSNFAANLLIEKLGAGNVQKTVDRLGAAGMQVLRGVEDQKAFEKGLNNTTTARALLVLLERIARHEAVDPQSDREMIEVLKRQRFNESIPAGLPQGVAVAHKTGSITLINHDAELMARLSRLVYEASQSKGTPGSAGALGEPAQDAPEDHAVAQRRQQRLDWNRPAGKRQVGAIQ
jgi:beta-lactamase class A